MYKLSEIKELIKLLDQSSLQELEIETEGFRLNLRKPNKTESVIVAPASYQSATQSVAVAPQALPAAVTPATAPAAAQKVDDKAHLHKIVSPMVGTFYKAPSPDAPAYVKVGDRVHDNSTVCIVEAMKLMNDIHAEVKGEIVEVLVEDGQLVEYGQALFLVKTE